MNILKYYPTMVGLQFKYLWFTHFMKSDYLHIKKNIGLYLFKELNKHMCQFSNTV